MLAELTCLPVVLSPLGLAVPLPGPSSSWGFCLSPNAGPSPSLVSLFLPLSGPLPPFCLILGLPLSFPVSIFLLLIHSSCPSESLLESFRFSDVFVGAHVCACASFPPSPACTHTCAHYMHTCTPTPSLWSLSQQAAGRAGPEEAEGLAGRGAGVVWRRGLFSFQARPAHPLSSLMGPPFLPPRLFQHLPWRGTPGP